MHTSRGATGLGKSTKANPSSEPKLPVPPLRARATSDVPARLPDGRGALVPPDTSWAARDPQAIAWRNKQNTPRDNDMARTRPTCMHKRARRPPTPACLPSRRTHRGFKKRQCRAASANVWSPQARTGNIYFSCVCKATPSAWHATPLHAQKVGGRGHAPCTSNPRACVTSRRTPVELRDIPPISRPPSPNLLGQLGFWGLGEIDLGTNCGACRGGGSVGMLRIGSRSSKPNKESSSAANSQKGESGVCEKKRPSGMNETTLRRPPHPKIQCWRGGPEAALFTEMGVYFAAVKRTQHRPHPRNIEIGGRGGRTQHHRLMGVFFADTGTRIWGTEGRLNP